MEELVDIQDRKLYTLMLEIKRRGGTNNRIQRLLPIFRVPIFHMIESTYFSDFWVADELQISKYLI